MSLKLPPAPAPSEGPGFPVYDPNQSGGVTSTADFNVPTAPAPAPAPDPLKDYKLSERDEKREQAKREGRELLFTIDDVDFFMPKEPDPQIGFRMMRDLRRRGEIYAYAGLIEELLGEDVLDALADTKSMSREDWDTIGEILATKVFSRMKDPMGKGSRRG